MANRSDRSSDTPPNVQGFKPAKQSGTELADTIRASSPRNDCTNRPDTRLHPTQPPKHQIEPCNAGAIHTGLSWSADLGNTPGESSTDGLVTRHAAAVASRIELGDYGPQAALHTTSDVVLSLLGRVYRRSSGLVKRPTEQRKAALSRGSYGKNLSQHRRIAPTKHCILLWRVEKHLDTQAQKRPRRSDEVRPCAAVRKQHAQGVQGSATADVTVRA